MTQVGGVEPSVEEKGRGIGFVWVVIAALLFVAFLVGGWLWLAGGAVTAVVGAKAHARLTRNRGDSISPHARRGPRGGWAVQGCHTYCTRSLSDLCDCPCDCDGEWHGVNAAQDDDEEDEEGVA